MKKIISVLSAFLLSISSFAQSPEKFSYQAVVRDASDALVVNSTTPIQISILKTSATGNEVYVETHSPTTNQNGLLSIVIGEGTVISGVMADLEWSTDVYFIKTEIDIDNNASYDVTGTSQLLSVPYALHAKTAENVTETQALSDVVALGNSANAQLKNVTDPTEPQDAVTKTYVDALIAELDVRITALEPQLAAIGDFRDGGIVFWVDPTDATHGLVCAVSDIPPTGSIGSSWGCQNTNIAGTSSTAIGAGSANTIAIVAGCTTPNIAADLTLDLSLNGFDDWFLPSRLELNEMYVNRLAINTTAAANGGVSFSTNLSYWSSTQANAGTAYGQNFNSGAVNAFNKDPSYSLVRAVRAF